VNRGELAVARAVVVAVGLASAPVFVACGPWVPSPRYGTHEGDEPIVVPEAPPPPQVQILPPRPRDLREAVWIDGQWLFRGRRWEWEPGRWEEPPPGATYAPPAVVYLPDKRIAWFAGRWRVAPERRGADGT
jgi:hypothetical protein